MARHSIVHNTETVSWAANTLISVYLLCLSAMMLCISGLFKTGIFRSPSGIVKKLRQPEEMFGNLYVQPCYGSFIYYTFQTITL